MGETKNENRLRKSIENIFLFLSWKKVKESIEQKAKSKIIKNILYNL